VVSFGLTSNDDNIVGGGWNIDDVLVKDGLATSVAEESIGGTPEGYCLHRCYPNPFNAEMRVSYSLPQAAEVRMAVVNLLGQEVRTLVHGRQPAGHTTVGWDATDAQGHGVASGVYVIVFEVRDVQGRALARQMQKVTVVR